MHFYETLYTQHETIFIKANNLLSILKSISVLFTPANNSHCSFLLNEASILYPILFEQTYIQIVLIY